MAKDVITRFKLETTQFDSKLRDSAKGLKSLTEQLSFAGNDFNRFAQKHVEAARALGNMQSGATNLKDKLKDLVGAYNDVVKAYETLTKEQQQSDYGKAMAESLTKLQGQIKQTKDELYNVGEGAKGTGGIMELFAQKLTVNIDALKLFQIGLKAANVALDVAKDAFFASEATVDEWGRTMASAGALYDGFLTAINNGDISGYLNNIDTIVEAARKAYNELDRLGTMKTIQTPQMSRQESENQRMRTMLMTGRYIAPLDGRKSAEGLKTGDLLSPDQIKNIEKHLQSGMQTVVTLTKNELDQTGRAVEAYYDSLAKQNGMSLKEFKAGTANMDEFDYRLEMARKYQEFEAAHTTRTEGIVNGLRTESVYRDNAVNPYEAYKNWATFRVDKMGENSYNDLVGLIRQQQQQSQQLYGQIGQMYRTVNRVEGVTVRGIMGGGSGGGSSTAKAAAATTKLTEEEKEAARQAKALAEAEKKRAEQLDKLRAEGADAVRNNSLKSAFAVQKKAQEGGYMGDTSIPLSFTMTQDNVSALMSELKTQIGQSDVGSDLYNALTEQFNDATSLSSLINYAMKNGIDGAELADVSQAMWQQLLGEGDIPDEALQSFKDSIGEALGKSLEFDSEGNVKEGENAGDKSWKEFQKSITQLSGVMSGVSAVGGGLQAMGIKLDEDVLNTIKGIQGAISVVQGVISIINALSVPSETANTIATNTNTVALGTLAAAINSNTFSRWVKPWAMGGIVHAAMGITVPGNHYSGDLVPAMVNSGELILNKAQQGNLAAQLEGGGGLQNLHLETKVSAEDIRFILSAASSRQNNTEYLNFDFV